MEVALDQPVLVLNRLWQAVNVIGARRAFAILSQGHAQVVHNEQDNFQTFELLDWIDFSASNPAWSPLIWGAYGGDEPTMRAAELLPEIKVWSRRGLVDCLVQYEALGWTGFVPEACRNTMVMVPINVAPFKGAPSLPFFIR